MPAQGRESQPTSSGSNDAAQVFPLIQRIRKEVESAIDSVLTINDLTGPTCDYAIVRPLTTLFARTRHPALLYSLLLVRTHFQDRSEDDLAFQAVNTSRAQLCEVLATKLLSLFETRSELPVILTTRFNAFAGVKRQSFDAGQEPLESEIQEMLQEGQDDMSSALEIAIESGAKRFIRSPAIQQFVTSIWTGELLYRPSSQHSIMKDSYKADTVEFFQLSSRPLLDHNVLRVPRVRRIIELGELLALVVLFFTVQQVRDIRKMELAEVLFILFTTGFALEEIAGLRERGWQTYFVHIWNIFDSTYLAIFLTYLIMRIVGLRRRNDALSTQAFDVLALGAPVLFPRLCGMLLRDSVVLLGLRAMLIDYVAFMFLAVLASAGFLVAFWVLAEGQLAVGQIAWVMVKVFLGNSYVGFDLASTFGEHLGPALMLVFAVFSNTLLLTILISILTNTFSVIQYNLVEESLYQNAVTTLDMVKGDALFEFMSPTNLIALPLLIPAKVFLDARRFHTVNVFLIRLANFPILAFIWTFYRVRRRTTRKNIQLNDKRSTGDLWGTLPRGFRRSVEDRLFERKVSLAGRTVRGLDDHPEEPPTSPVAIRGSGGQRALGLSTSSSDTSGGAQATSLLAQLFRPSNGDTQKASNSQKVPEDRYAAMEQKLDKIEKMLDRLLSGGLKVDNDDR